MMTHTFSCDEFAARLPDYLEHDLDDATRVALEAHASACAACGSLLADLRELRIAAPALPELVPEHDLWSGIAERIAAPVLPLDARPRRDDHRARSTVFGRTLRWSMLGAAAAALIVISVGTTYLAMRGRSGSQSERQVATSTGPVTTPAPVGSIAAPARPGTSVAAAPSVAAESAGTPSLPRSTARLASVTNQKPSAEETYGREIATLRAVVARRRSTLDTATIAVIEKNLAIIDSAIVQCRAALAKDPASGFLLQSLNSALEAKVDLLRTAATLPAHT